jgi:phytoene/squalene synthetase
MGLLDLTIKLLGLSETLHRWRGLIRALDAGRREKVARYADRVAETLGRAAAALARLESEPGSARAAREAARELGRIAGYVEDIVRALEHHLDGRKLAGVKRRLEGLGGTRPLRRTLARVDAGRIERLLEAEGYFRALADRLRA